MSRPRGAWLLAALWASPLGVPALSACREEPGTETLRPLSRHPAQIDWTWDLPPGFPEPIVPADNPMSAPSVELGRHLFHDERLSLSGTQSCASCHQQALAFTEGLAHSVGSTGQPHPRGALSLANVAYMGSLTWANPVLVRLEAQVLIPIFGTDPVELGWSGRERELEERLRAEPRYVELFDAAYPEEEEPIAVRNVVRSLATFQRTLISGDSPVDRYRAGDVDALSAAARRGLDLFESDALRCSSCHAGFALSDAALSEETGDFELLFHNTGLYDVDGEGAYPAGGTGLFATSGRPEDMGAFRTPGLRNIALSAPYMHDGSVASLDEVLDHYARGGRLVTSGPHAGDGRENPFKDPRIAGFVLSDDDRASLLAFFDALTDEAFVTDPWFGDPW